MKKMTWATAFAFVLLAATAVTAQEGNGLGSSFITATPAKIGGTYTVSWGSPGLSYATTVLLAASSFGPTTHPVAGQLWIDYNTAQVYGYALDVNGNMTLSTTIPNVPSIVGLAPAYLMAVVVDFSLPYPFLSIPKTIPVFFENPDSYHPTTTSLVGGGRTLHTATAIGANGADNRTRILVAGGGNGTLTTPVATATTEIFDTLTRSFVAGPTMSIDRALHSATRLSDGRVLIVGGADSNGVATATCDIYDPQTNTFSAATPMGSVRAGHTATLLSNGKVLVCGGVTTFSGGQANLVNILNSALNTGEVYDPTLNSWTPVSNTMSAKRFFGAATALNNGNALIVSGINGGATVLGQGTATFTTSCNTYNPATNAFATTGSIGTGRAGAGISVLANGDVLVTGGIVSGFLSVPTASTSCQRFNGTAWSSVAALPTGIAMHTQMALPNGDAFIAGGVTGTLLALGATANAGTHTGAAYTASAALGTNPGITGAAAQIRGSHTATPLFDGSFLIVGGTDGVTGLASAMVYTK